jgi:MATE family multidrug resistance protein
MEGEGDDPVSLLWDMAACRREPSLWDLEEMRKEFWGFVHYAGPPTISYALDAAVEIIALAYIAKIGERELAAAGLAFMLSNMTGHAVYTGMSTALGTIGSQAYGAQKYHLVGNILQQSLVVVGATLIPISILWVFAGSIFHLSGIVPEIAAIAGTIIRLQILTLPPMALMQLIKVWLESQGILRPITYASVVVCAFTGCFCHLFIGMDLLGLGVYGAPMAILVSYTLGDVFLLALIIRRGYHLTTWQGFSKHVWIGIGTFAALAYMGAGMVCLEWWSYEVLGVVGSAFGETATAVQTVLVNFSYFLYAAGEGIAISAGTRVGNALGAGDAVAAQRSSIMAMLLALGSSFIIVLPLGPSEGEWASSFLKEEDSVDLVATCTPALMIFLVFNGCYGALSGILLGSGKQKIGVMANFFACYVVGVPLGLLLSFHYKMSILGLWWGQCAGVALLCAILSGYLLSLDWQDLANSTHAAALAGEAELDEREAKFYALLEANIGEVEMKTNMQKMTVEAEAVSLLSEVVQVKSD